MLRTLERERIEIAGIRPLPSYMREHWLATQAVEALLDEARLTPKPALVDQRGCGAHGDLSLGMMELSARTLHPYFLAMAKAGRTHSVGMLLRETLGALGRAAETAMMHATGGVNTHRGAIWALGLFVAADAGAGTAAELCERAAEVAAIEDRFAASAASHGRAALQAYGAGGARAEAVAGFPHVFHVGLPALRAARRKGAQESTARLDTLLAIMSTLDDTCLLHRGGLDALHAAQQGAFRVLAQGGSATVPGQQALRALDAALLRLWASPGGSADLLAATLFVDRTFPETIHA